MKKVELERQAIVKALDTESNITEAAKALGASRRTLQARMRDHNIPPGHAGRPRQLLPKAGETGAGGLTVLAIAVGAGVWLWRRGKQTVTGDRKPDCLRGLDIITR